MNGRMSPLAMFLAAIEEINMAVVSDLKRVKFDRNSDLKWPGGAAGPGRVIAGSEPKPVGAEIAGRRAIVGADSRLPV
jgi:hypothetical protein